MFPEPVKTYFHWLVLGGVGYDIYDMEMNNMDIETGLFHQSYVPAVAMTSSTMGDNKCVLVIFFRRKSAIGILSVDFHP